MRVVALLLAFCLFIPTAWAAESKVDPSSGVLPEVVVTATAVPTSSKEVPVHVQVITSEEIQNSNAKDVSDVLQKYVPGHFHKFANDFSGVGIRGFRSNMWSGTDLKSKTLILIDGMRAGTGRVSSLPVDNVDRIEVVRGPGSVIYGASAMGGVINIITRRGSGELSGNIGGEVGSDSQYRVKGGVEGGLNEDALGYSLAGHYERIGSYTTGSGESVQNSQVADRGISGSMTYRPEDGKSLDVVGIYNYSHKGAPNQRTFASLTDNSRSTYERMSADWTSERKDDALGWYARGYATQVLYNWNNQATHINTFTGGLRTGADIKTGGFGNLLVGIEYDRITEDQRKSVWGPNTDYNNYAVLAEQKIIAGDFTFYAGGRFDDYNMTMKDTPSLSVTEESKKFANLSWRGGAVWDVAEWVGLRAAVGTGFVTPTAEQLAGSYTSMGTTYTGNPDLKAETATTYEIGSDFYFDVVNAGLTVFHTYNKDAITTKDTGPGNKTYTNIKGIRLTGLEGHLRSMHELTYKETRIVFSSYLNGIYYLNRKNEDDAQNAKAGSDVPLYISDMTVTAGLRTDIGKRFTHDINMVYVGEQRSEVFRTWPSTFTTMDPHVVFGTRFTFRPEEKASLYLDVQNLFDTAYDCVDDYPMPGRNLKLGVNYEF